jgi:PAS domain S-box-containing protein
MQRGDGWSGLFSAAFRQSKNAMVLADERRVIVDANGSFVALLGRSRNELVDHPLFEFVDGGPLLTESEWDAALAEGRFTGEAVLLCADGGTVGVQWGASTEVATGRRLVLFVALSTSRWGARFRAAPEPGNGELSPRQREIVRLVAHGLTGQEIADELVIAHETRAHLVAKALAEGRF